MAKEREKQMDKVCEKLVCKIKEYNFVENLAQNYVEIMVKKFCGKICWNYFWKSWIGNVG